MKNCQFCQAELDDSAAFCSQCGNKQQAAVVQAQPQMPQAPPPVLDPVQAPPPPAYYAPPPPPKEPSLLASEGKRYMSWLTRGFLGTSEPIHLLYAAIVPFLIALFYTLSMARFMSWHAGGFFLLWFFSMVMVAALPAAAWLLNRFWLKAEAGLIETFSAFSSFSNVILPLAFVVMILGLAGAGFAFTLGSLIPVLVLAASAMLLVPAAGGDQKKLWLAVLILAAVFIVLQIIWGSIYSAGRSWGFPRFF